MAFLTIFLIVFSYSYIQGATADTKIEITNNCPDTVWAATNNPNGGQELASGQSWNLTLPVLTQTGRIWARTGCNFDVSGKGSCATGDCGGQLQCKGPGANPSTYVGYMVYQYDNSDYYYISVTDGFNLPISVAPTPPSTGPKCIPVACKNDINAVCPSELKVTGGCKSGCGAFPSNDSYCCAGAFSGDNCNANKYSKIFKAQCPEAYTYIQDTEEPGTNCDSGTGYKVTFCP